jgi:hypothetical protein
MGKAYSILDVMLLKFMVEKELNKFMKKLTLLLLIWLITWINCYAQNSTSVGIPRRLRRCCVFKKNAVQC